MLDRPAHAVLLWTDGANIYAEVPLATGQGFQRITFPASSLGLHKALNLLRDHRPTARPPSIPPAPRPPKGYTPNQAQAALAVLGKIRR